MGDEGEGGRCTLMEWLYGIKCIKLITNIYQLLILIRG